MVRIKAREKWRQLKYIDDTVEHIIRGLAIGIGVGLLPLFGVQMLIATLFAKLLRGNVSAALAGTWISNPLTFLPIFYFEYRLGAMLLDVPVQDISIELSWQWLTSGLVQIWKPLLLGAFVSATVGATLVYVAINLLWRQSTIARYKRRKIKPKQIP